MIQDALYDMLRTPPQRLVRLSGDARPRHRARHLLGRPARAGARGDRPTSRSSSASTPSEPRAPARAHRVRARRLVYSILARIVRATQVDTILHTHLIVDSTELPGRTLHEINVIGTMNLLAAAGAAGQPGAQGRGEELRPRVRRQLPGPVLLPRGRCRARSPPRTNVERSLLEVEAFLRDFADDNPHVTVTLLRFANVLGDDIDTPFSTALRRPVVPEIFGFDPRLQFMHEDDVVGALMYATTNDVPGVYNVARRRHVPWSEVCAIVGQAPRRAAAAVHQPRRPSRCACSGSWTSRPRCSACCATAAARQQPVQARRLPLPVHHRGHRRRVRPQPAAREHGRRQPARVPVRARGRDFFRHSPAVVRDDRTEPRATARRTARPRRARHARRPRAPQRAHRADGRRDRRDVRRARSRRRASARSWSPARRPRSARAPTSSALAALAPRTRGARATSATIYEGFLRVLRSPLPTVAAVNGPAVGAGFNLALACDVRLAGTSARFDARFLRIGLHPGGGHTWMLDRAVGPQAAAAHDPVRRAARRRPRRGDRARVGVRPRRRAARPRAGARGRVPPRPRGSWRSG